MQFRGTTIVCVRKNGKCALAGDGQVTMGESVVMKATAVKVRKLFNDKVNKCTAKFRYRKEEEPVEVEYLSDTEVLVKYPQGIKSVTPGQACVFYVGDKCIGGGIIKEVRKNDNKLWYLL